MPLFYQHNINGNDKLGVWNIAEDEKFFMQKVPLHRNISHERKRLQHLAGRYLLQYLYPDFPYQLIEIADTHRPFIKNESYHFSISHCGDFAAAIVSQVNRVGVDIELVTPMVERIRFKFLNPDELEFTKGTRHEEQDLRQGTRHEEQDLRQGTRLEEQDLRQATRHEEQGTIEGTRHETQDVPQGEMDVHPQTSNLKLQTSNPDPQTSNFKPQTLKVKPDSANLEWLTMLWSAKEAIYKWYGDGLVDFRKHIHYTGVWEQAADGWIELSFLFLKEKPVPLKIRCRLFGLLVLSYVLP